MLSTLYTPVTLWKEPLCIRKYCTFDTICWMQGLILLTLFICTARKYFVSLSPSIFTYCMYYFSIGSPRILESDTSNSVSKDSKEWRDLTNLFYIYLKNTVKIKVHCLFSAYLVLPGLSGARVWEDDPHFKLNLSRPEYLDWDFICNQLKGRETLGEFELRQANKQINKALQMKALIHYCVTWRY